LNFEALRDHGIVFFKPAEVEQLPRTQWPVRGAIVLKHPPRLSDEDFGPMQIARLRASE